MCRKTSICGHLMWKAYLVARRAYPRMRVKYRISNVWPWSAYIYIYLLLYLVCYVKSWIFLTSLFSKSCISFDFFQDKNSEFINNILNLGVETIDKVQI